MNEPNPDWVSAPYEESGIVDLKMLTQTVECFACRFKSLTITIERTDGGMFKFLLTAPACECVKR